MLAGRTPAALGFIGLSILCERTERPLSCLCDFRQIYA